MSKKVVIKNAMAFRKEMRRLIRLVREEEFAKVDLSTDSMECLSECVERGYIIGISVARVASGNAVFDMSSPRVTLKGFCFLSLDITRSDVIAVIALIISIIALFGSC